MLFFQLFSLKMTLRLMEDYKCVEITSLKQKIKHLDFEFPRRWFPLCSEPCNLNAGALSVVKGKSNSSSINDFNS